MKKEFNSFVKSIFIYGFGNVSVKIIGLILLPLYTNTDILTSDEYGAMGMLDISSQFLISLFSLALGSAYFRWYWDKEYKDQRKTIFFTCFSTLTILAFSLALSGVFSADALSRLLFGHNRFARAFTFMVIASSLQPLIDFTLAQMRAENRASFFVSSNITKLIISLVATIIFLKYTKFGLSGIYIAQLLGNISFLVISSGYVFKSMELRFSKTILKGILKYSYPLALATVSNVLLVGLDRYVLNYKSTLLDVAIYNQGFKLANTTKVFVVSSIQLALTPAIFKIMNRPDHKEIYSRIMTWFTIVVVYFSLFMSLFGLEITKLFTTDKIYFDAYKIIPVFCLAITFSMLKDVSLTGLQIKKKTKIIGLTIACIAAFNLALNLFLVPIWGIYGAAVSSTVSQLVFFAVMYFSAQRSYHIPYRLDKVIIVIIAAALLYLAGCSFNGQSLPIRVLVKSLSLLLFPLLLFLMRVISGEEIKMIWSTIVNIKNLVTSGKKEDLPPAASGSDENQ